MSDFPIPLPEPEGGFTSDGTPIFTAAQMLAFGRSVAEECACIAETAPDGLQDSTFDGVARKIRSEFS